MKIFTSISAILGLSALVLGQGIVDMGTGSSQPVLIARQPALHFVPQAAKAGAAANPQPTGNILRPRDAMPDAMKDAMKRIASEKDTQLHRRQLVSPDKVEVNRIESTVSMSVAGEATGGAVAGQGGIGRSSADRNAVPISFFALFCALTFSLIISG